MRSMFSFLRWIRVCVFYEQAQDSQVKGTHTHIQIICLYQIKTLYKFSWTHIRPFPLVSYRDVPF